MYYRLARDKHSSLLGLPLSYEEHELIRIRLELLGFTIEMPKRRCNTQHNDRKQNNKHKGNVFVINFNPSYLACTMCLFNDILTILIKTLLITTLLITLINST